MATEIVGGPRTWDGERDEESHRTYRVVYLVKGAITDGPATALQTPGLPTYGSPYQIDGDLDIWAFCRWNVRITPQVTKEPNNFWELEFTFSTKPIKNCKDQQTEDPLLEPQEISGSFVKYTEEATRDRFGEPINNSAHEQMRGHQVEFDANRPQIKIKQNVASLDYPTLALFQDRVNAFTLWGLPPRTIKLSSITWERKFYGQCYLYYTRTFEFDVRYDGFDRDILDEGTKVLSGQWDDTTGAWVLVDIGGSTPDPTNPTHFIRFKDRKGENTRVILNGHGLPAEVIIPGTQSFYISTTPGNTTNPEESDTWILILGNHEQPIADWVAGTDYSQGNLVGWDGLIYVADEDVVLVNVPPDDPLQSSVWIDLGPWDGSIPNDRGTWSASSTYEIGDMVLIDSTTTSHAGNIHIEKYQEADFLLLGIPLDF